MLGAMVAILLPTVSLAESRVQASSFDDVTRIHANFQAIDALREAGVVVGYDDGNFGEDRPINRAEFLKIAMEIGDFEAKGSGCYSDVADEWFAGYVCAATEVGLVNGYADGSFKPGHTINFAEASKMIAKVFAIGEGETQGVWYESYVNALEERSAIPAQVDSFSAELTRAEMAEIVWRLKNGITYKVSNDMAGLRNGVAKVEVGGALQKFDSCSELTAYNRENAMSYRWGLDDFVMSSDSPVEESRNEGTGSAQPEDLGAGESAPSYSETNVQVQGVDEADMVKTDGEYIYYLKDDTVKVVRAYPADQMVELSEITFGDDAFWGTDMYLDGDKLVVLGSSWGNLIRPMDVAMMESSIMPYPGYYNSVTRILVFDISDKSNVSLWRELSYDGDYSESRKVDGTVYFVMNKWFNPYYVDTIEEEAGLPYVYDSSEAEVREVASCDAVTYMPGVIDVDNYLMVGALSLDDLDSEVDVEVLLGSSGDVYASRDNLYVASAKYHWDFSGSAGYEEETVIHKFALDGNSVEYKGVGSVPGVLLNQFSMDESEGYFRVATTTGDFWSDDNPSSNNVYVLNEDMNVVGRLEGVAMNERIYSVRFMGDVAYMVTFKNVDPFFVLDLSSPTSPRILGELKLPGYSDYLHPYKDNYVIGFGKDAVDPSAYDDWMWGDNFAWYQGMKVAMFDVTDLTDPKLLHSMVIGDRGTESALLSDHKALMFDEERGLMAFPISISTIPENIKNDPQTPGSAYGKTTFIGAHVYDVSVENGFSLRGAVTHLSDDFFAGGEDYYWFYDGMIERILYIGNYIYTVSDSIIQANNLSGLSFVKRVDFN